MSQLRNRLSRFASRKFGAIERRPKIRTGLRLASLLLATACAPIGRVPPDVTTRHFASTESAGNGARWHIFLFAPEAPRPLGARIALARRAIADDPACRWVGAPRAAIARRTAAQGARFTETTLAAPVRCDT